MTHRDVATATHAGRRPINEDSSLVATGMQIYALADGSGSGEHGSIASRTATRVVGARARTLRKQLGTDHPHPDHLVGALFDEAHHGIQRAALACRAARMGASMAVVTVTGHRAQVAHVGNTRVWLLRDGQIVQLTCDHTLGSLCRRLQPDRSRGPLDGRLYQALGFGKEEIYADYLDVPLQEGDVILLTTVGVHKALSPQDLENLLAMGGDLNQQATRIVQAAVHSSGKHNASVVLKQYSPKA